MTGRSSVAGGVVSPDVRARILDEIVKDEVTGGARVDHRDTVTAVLAKGSDRVLVTVDQGGTVHLDRLERTRPGSRRRRFVAIVALTIGVVMVVVVLLGRRDMLPV